MKKRQGSVKQGFSNLMETGLDILKDITSLFFLELSLVKQNLFMVLSLAGLMGLFLMTVWGCINFLLVNWLISHQYRLESAVSIIMVLNLLLAVSVFLLILTFKDKLGFEETQKELKKLMETSHE